MLLGTIRERTTAKKPRVKIVDPGMRAGTGCIVANKEAARRIAGEIRECPFEVWRLLL
jgi:hypothetical protein